MKVLKVLCFVFLAVALFRFMREMWITVELRDAAPAQLVAMAKTIVPPDRHPTPASTPASLPAAAVNTPSPLPSVPGSPPSLAPLGRAPLRAPTPKPKATPFLDKDGKLREVPSSGL